MWLFGPDWALVKFTFCVGLISCILSWLVFRESKATTERVIAWLFAVSGGLFMVPSVLWLLVGWELS
jgi:uncharacterized membrane protein